MTYTAIVQDDLSTSRVDQLLELLRDGHNAVATPFTLVTRYETTNEWRDPRHESVNTYLFDDLVIDKDSYPMPEGLKNSGARPSTEFILLHDTANLPYWINGHMVHSSKVLQMQCLFTILQEIMVCYKA